MVMRQKSGPRIRRITHIILFQVNFASANSLHKRIFETSGFATTPFCSLFLSLPLSFIFPAKKNYLIPSSSSSSIRVPLSIGMSTSVRCNTYLQIRNIHRRLHETDVHRQSHMQTRYMLCSMCRALESARHFSSLVESNGSNNA